MITDGYQATSFIGPVPNQAWKSLQNMTRASSPLTLGKMEGNLAKENQIKFVNV